jgi:hypothetical protein
MSEIEKAIRAFIDSVLHRGEKNRNSGGIRDRSKMDIDFSLLGAVLFLYRSELEPKVCVKTVLERRR